MKKIPLAQRSEFRVSCLALRRNAWGAWKPFEKHHQVGSMQTLHTLERPPPSKKHEEIEGVSFAAAKKYGKTTTKNELL